MHEMNRKIVIGFIWNLVGIFSTNGATIVFTMFLARMLDPEAFGLIALMMIFFELGNVLVNSGLGQALIRSSEVSDEDLNTVFFANIILSILAYLFIYLGAPYLAAFYERPDLVALVQVSGLVVFFNALKVVQTAVLSRAMDFKVQTKAKSLGVIISGVVAIILAYIGSGVWSLVAQIIISAAISAFYLWLYSDWRPSYRVSTISLYKLSKFGLHLLAEGVLSVLFQNSYILVIGRFFSAEITGLYFLAQKISRIISQQLSNAIQQASLPALSVLQDNNQLLLHKYRHIIQIIMFVVSPIMLIMAAVAEPMFELVFDHRWSGAVLYVQLFSLHSILYPLHAMNLNVLMIKDRPDLVFRIGLIKKVVNMVLLILAIPYGVIGIIVSQIIASVLAMIPNVYYAVKLIDYSLKCQILDAVKPILVALIAGIVSWGVVQAWDVHVFLGLCSAVLIGCVFYILLSVLFKVDGAVLVIRKFQQRFKLVGELS